MSTSETPFVPSAIPDQPAASVVRSSPMRWGVAFVLFLAVISAFFDRISIAVLFTNVTFQNDMGIGFDPTRLGLLMTSFVFAYGVSGLFLSFVGDIYGPRRSLAIGAGLWGGAMLLMGSAGSYTSMLFYRIVLGIAEGPQFALTNSLVKRWFPPREQARANSIWMVGSPLGSGGRFSAYHLPCRHLRLAVLVLLSGGAEPARYSAARVADRARPSAGRRNGRRNARAVRRELRPADPPVLR